jgi:hypothetical protein
MAEAPEASGISYEELAELEKEFDDVELEISQFHQGDKLYPSHCSIRTTRLTLYL